MFFLAFPTTESCTIGYNLLLSVFQYGEKHFLDCHDLGLQYPGFTRKSRCVLNRVLRANGPSYLLFYVNNTVKICFKKCLKKYNKTLCEMINRLIFLSAIYRMFKKFLTNYCSSSTPNRVANCLK